MEKNQPNSLVESENDTNSHSITRHSGTTTVANSNRYGQNGTYGETDGNQVNIEGMIIYAFK